MSVGVECFFCGESFPSQIVKGKKGFTCLNCENYNGFDESSSTGYNRTIPEMYDSNLNPRAEFSKDGDYSLKSRVFYDPFEFCPTCQRAQNRNPQEFRTCSECRLKVVAHLRRLDDRTEDTYGESAYENAVHPGQSSYKSSQRNKRRTRRREYGFFEKVISRILHFCLMILVPVQVVYLCLLNYQMVIGVSTFGWWEEMLWKVLIIILIPLFLRGFMFPFLMLVVIVWSPRFVNWMCVDKKVWCGGNEEIIAFIISLCLTIFKIVKDEVRRVKVCSQLRTEHERRQCYLYSNLFNEEDRMGGKKSRRKSQNEYEEEIEETGNVNMKGIKDEQKRKAMERERKKMEKVIRRDSYSNSVTLPRKKRTIIGMFRKSRLCKLTFTFIISVLVSLIGMTCLEYALKSFSIM